MAARDVLFQSASSHRWIFPHRTYEQSLQPSTATNISINVSNYTQGFRAFKYFIKANLSFNSCKCVHQKKKKNLKTEKHTVPHKQAVGDSGKE